MAGLSGLGVEADQQLVGECDADYLWGLACKSLSEGDEVGFVAGGDAGDDEEDLADGGSSSADSSPALMFAAVLSQGREACELGDGFVGEGADLGHFSHDAGYGAVGDALDGAEGEVEFAPERVSGEKLGDGCGEGLHLAFEQCKDLGEGGLDGGVGDEPLLVLLRGAEVGELAQAGDQRAQMLLAGWGEGCWVESR